jgi:hypothetical protein
VNLATLTERIREAITTGSMPAQLSLGYAAVDFTIGDLLRPWGKLYPGVPEALASAETPQPFDYRSPLRRPTLNPSPRRSPRMLQPPRRIPASPRMIQKSLLSSMSGIWDYYKHHGLADRRILRNMLTAESLEQFLDPLQNIASNYSPMEMDLENINYSDIIGLTGFNLFIPCETYEDEGAGVIQGFLEGVSGVRWLLENYFESSENGEDLPKQDKKLIAEVGFEAILTAYAAAPSPKMADLEKLGDFSKTYFGQVEKDYPEHYSTDFDIISGDGGSNNSLTITSRQDIEFALAYAEAYFDMMGDIPTPWQFTENHEGVFDTFVHEICEAWRKANGKRAVKWTSPQQKTLAVRFRTGDL